MQRIKFQLRCKKVRCLSYALERFVHANNNCVVVLDANVKVANIQAFEDAATFTKDANGCATQINVRVA